MSAPYCCTASRLGSPRAGARTSELWLAACPAGIPIPGGAPGRFRYWDGTAWSAETTDRPGPAGPAPAGRDGPGDRDGRGLVAALAVVALLVIIAIAAVIIITPAGAPGHRRPAADLHRLGGDDRSPTPTPTPPPPSGLALTAAARTPCPWSPAPRATPTSGEPHPVDDRVYGGNLSFPEEPSFDAADGRNPVQLRPRRHPADADRRRHPGWIAQLAVGPAARRGRLRPRRAEHRRELRAMRDHQLPVRPVPAEPSRPAQPADHHRRPRRAG